MKIKNNKLRKFRRVKNLENLKNKIKEDYSKIKIKKDSYKLKNLKIIKNNIGRNCLNVSVAKMKPHSINRIYFYLLLF